jgi:phage terminase large subunit
MGISTSPSSPTKSLSPERRAVLEELVRRGLTLPKAEPADWKNEPVGYLREVLKADTWQRQNEIAEAVRDCRRVAVRSCHHSGKTFLAGGLVPWYLTAYDPALVITTAPTDRQVRKQLWGEINRHVRRAGLTCEVSTMEMSLGPDQKAYGFTTNEPDKFQGWHSPNILFIVDEASGVGELIYQAIEGCLTGPNAKLLLIGNPTQAGGTFFEAFRSPLYEKFHISAHDVPERLLPAAWAEEREKVWGKDSPIFKVRVLGEFPPQGEDSLINLQWVEDAFDRVLQPSGEVEIGADIARFGSDESTAYVRQGSVVIDFESWRGQDTVVSAGRIAALARRHGATMVKVDDIGVGGGPTDTLAHELEAKAIAVVGVNVGLPAFDKEMYFNRRTEIFQGLADRFREGDIALPKDDTLLDQLTQLRYTFTPRGQKKLTPKEEMKKTRASATNWQSPDRADGLALAFCVAPGFVGGAAAGESRDAGWLAWG